MSRRVAIIGHTGVGDYGHGLDQAFVGVERASMRPGLRHGLPYLPYSISAILRP
ncbi:MAG: hypothetical protein OXH96_25940 [Spirochaetaceae bacterium]|nr:hypothetical protein [Spirochaetaceae bacterium]